MRPKTFAFIFAMLLTMPLVFPKRVVVERWRTNTGLRDSVVLWGYGYDFTISPTKGLVLRNGLVEVNPFPGLKNHKRR